MQQERVTLLSCVYIGFSRMHVTLSVMATFANTSYSDVHKTIVFQIVYITMQDFEVIFMYLSVTLQKCSKPLSTTFLKSHPFLLHWSIVTGDTIQLCFATC